MSKNTDPNQAVLPSTDLVDRRVNLNARNAFGRVPFVEYFGVDSADFNEVTPYDELLVEPSKLEPLLYDSDAKNRRRRPYPEIGWVVLSPSEFATIPSSAGYLAERVEARTYAQAEGMGRPIDERRASAKRAGAHALDNTVVPQLRNLAHGYNNQIADLRWLKKEIPKHYLAHSSEGQMRMVAHTALEAFSGTVETIGLSQDWSGDKIEIAKLAMKKKLLHGRGGGTLELKKDYWSTMINIAGNHIIAKKSVVAARASEANSIIDRHLR